VLDFGLARRFQTPQGRTEIPGSTIPGRPLGTLSYMAPERIMQLPLDPRCDLFSLGVVVYEMVTGTLPFKGDSPFDTVTSILEGTYTRPTKLAPASPVKLEAVIQRLLCKLPDDRYQSARDLLDDLAAIASSQRSSPMLQVLRRLMSR
jgi:serine/threonine-protein kinase